MVDIMIFKRRFKLLCSNLRNVSITSTSLIVSTIYLTIQSIFFGNKNQLQ